jgi:hypothetical protein
MGLGDLAKNWAKAKATEMLSSDSNKSDAAAQQADAVEQEAKDDATHQLLRSAFPKLGEWEDKQKQREQAAVEERAQKHRDEIAALPTADVQLRATGWTSDSWFGSLPLRWEVLQPEAPDPEYTDPDPYAHKPALAVELATVEGQRPSLGGHDMVRWGFQIPGYTGDGTYDLSAIAREREAAGAALDYLDWVMEFADSDDSGFYFYSEAGPSTVTVSDGEKRLSVSISMSGAIGELAASAEITRSGGPGAG